MTICPNEDNNRKRRERSEREDEDFERVEDRFERREDRRERKEERCDEREEFCRFPKHPVPKKVLLECGCNSQDAEFEIDDDEIEEDQKFVLASVVVDTTCLCRPQVKIEFSSLVQFDAESEDGDDEEIEVDLLFKLIRVCHGDVEVLQTWRFTKELEIEDDDEFEIEFSEPFTVTFCDRPCPDCCTYKMIVEGREFEGEFEFLRVVKADISAIAQSLCND